MAGKKRTTYFEDNKETFMVGREIGFQDLLRTQLYWINKAIAESNGRVIINLVFGLESMMLPYADGDYKAEITKLIKRSLSSVQIAKEKYRHLIVLMDRRGFLIEKSRIDEI